MKIRTTGSYPPSGLDRRSHRPATVGQTLVNKLMASFNLDTSTRPGRCKALGIGGLVMRSASRIIQAEGSVKVGLVEGRALTGEEVRLDTIV